MHAENYVHEQTVAVAFCMFNVLEWFSNQNQGNRLGQLQRMREVQ